MITCKKDDERDPAGSPGQPQQDPQQRNGTPNDPATGVINLSKYLLHDILGHANIA